MHIINILVKIENIAKNKLQLFESLPNDGYAFVNMDDNYLNKLSLSIKYSYLWIFWITMTFCGRDCWITIIYSKWLKN